MTAFKIPGQNAQKKNDWLLVLEKENEAE